MRIQAVLAGLAIEALDKGAQDWFAGLNECNFIPAGCDWLYRETGKRQVKAGGEHLQVVGSRGFRDRDACETGS